MAHESCNLDKDETERELLKPSSPSPPPPPPIFHKPTQDPPIHRPETAPAASKRPAPSYLGANSEDEVPPPPQTSSVSRCSSCKRKVGLTGFRCRCGDLFCGRHRYSDVHECSFDYKAVGREEILKANPVVRASKIIKI
ncbi:Zinc finger AN1 domain-containing stress-associated protein 15 [Acorus gramineus]|uniref:Zinc finger AN1 domain-containing stress-associated protein 15 n=1 Tax=Acorus gramineus TaxID=55184 RepID=A0AAV9AUD2_ACOGR|nr:Zinc finger AN1 domain-containing stress-associated protein 15 [Acorus gramineus]